jgi:coenzyme Q-binding protein COQ10
VSWTFVDGDFMKDNKGSWQLEEQGEGVTKATYNIEVALGPLVPKTIVNALVDTSLPKLLENFKKRAEALAAKK